MDTHRDTPPVRAWGLLQATLELIAAIRGELETEDRAAFSAVQGHLEVASVALERAQQALERVARR